MIESTSEKLTPQQRTEAALKVVVTGLRQQSELLALLSGKVAPGVRSAIIALGEYVGKAAVFAERLLAILNDNCLEDDKHRTIPK